MRITVNGKPVTVKSGSLSRLRQELELFGQVAVVNGYQVPGDCALMEGDTVTVIEKGVAPSKDELESMLSARLTPGVYQRVKNARVGVAGLGGLGSNIAVMLAQTGVGSLVLVDFDVVEPSNLNRQHYDMRHLGQAKTDALRDQLGEINPFVAVETACVRVTEENAAELFQGCSVVCEAFDDPASKAMLTQAVLSITGVKLVGSSGMAGYGSANEIKTEKRMRNFYLCGDFETESRPGCGLMSPRVQVCAGHQANMVLRLLLGMEEC